MIQALYEMLLDYVEDKNYIDPVMITFTTKFNKGFKGRFLTLRYWKDFNFKMMTSLPYREYRWNPIAWVLEESENKVHIHVIHDGIMNVKLSQELWTKLNRHDLGRVFATVQDTYEIAFNYILKDYMDEDKPVDKFFGLFVTLRPQGIYHTF